MRHHNPVQKQSVGLGLLSRPKITHGWVPRFLCGRKRWKVFSGTWKEESSNRILYLHEAEKNTGENISVIGSPDWDNYTFQVNLSGITKSTKPPEGGAILYFHFLNMRNYYSFHVCRFKQKIEVIKRYQGIWSTLTTQEYELMENNNHSIQIHTHAGTHQIQIDGSDRIEIRDHDIATGCIGIGAKYCNVELRHASVSIHE